MLGLFESARDRKNQRLVLGKVNYRWLVSTLDDPKSES